VQIARYSAFASARSAFEALEISAGLEAPEQKAALAVAIELAEQMATVEPVGLAAAAEHKPVLRQTASLAARAEAAPGLGQNHPRRIHLVDFVEEPVLSAGLDMAVVFAVEKVCCFP